MRANILIFDNSVSITGAFSSILSDANVLKEDYNLIFVMPKKSGCIDELKRLGYEFYQIRYFELRRNIFNVLFYPVVLLINIYFALLIVKKVKPHTIIANDYYNLIPAGLKIFYGKFKLITFVRFQPKAINPILNFLWTRIALILSNKIVAVSKTVLNQLPTSEKIVLVYNSINIEEKLPEKTMINFPLRFLYLSNYIDGKGHLYALEAFSRLEGKENCRLIFFGNDMGLLKNKKYKKFLVEQAYRLGISNFVEFNGPVRDIEEIYKSHDVFLNFSESESFSRTCMEASFYGLPVIATNSGGPSEIVVDGFTGFLVRVRSIDEMVSRMKILFENQEQILAMGLEGRKFVTKKFSLNNTFQIFKELLVLSGVLFFHLDKNF